MILRFAPREVVAREPQQRISELPGGGEAQVPLPGGGQGVFEHHKPQGGIVCGAAGRGGQQQVGPGGGSVSPSFHCESP